MKKYISIIKDKNFNQKIWEIIEKNKFIIFFTIITIISLIIRMLLLSYESDDYIDCLSPWFNMLKENGGFKALSMEIGNYNAPYMQILALLTYLPIHELMSIKLVSIIFDYVCAFAAIEFVNVLEKRSEHVRFKEIIIYFIILFLPTTILNSACWGQADSIYTAFSLLAILALIKEKYVKSFILLGIAFSFKLQAVFILPIYILIYLSQRKFSICNFLIIPLVDVVMCLPSLISGRSLINCVNIYAGQIYKYSDYLEMNFPNIYSLLFSKEDLFVVAPNDYIAKVGLWITIGIFAIMAFSVMYKKLKFDKIKIVEFGLWSIMIATFFLPHMHDRYLFIADILSAIYYFYNKKRIYIPIGVSAISLYTYDSYLFEFSPIPVEYVAILFFALIIILTKDIYDKYMVEK